MTNAMNRFPVLVALLAVVTLAQQPQSRVPPAHAKESLAIIVNRENPLDNLSMSELRTIFLGERTHWPNGRKITLVTMEDGHAEGVAIARDVCRMSEADLRRRYLQKRYTNEMLVPPKTLVTPKFVREFVFNVPGAIGYLRPEDVDDSVKVISIDDHRPADAEYPLHIEEHSKN